MLSQCNAGCFADAMLGYMPEDTIAWKTHIALMVLACVELPCAWERLDTCQRHCCDVCTCNQKRFRLLLADMLCVAAT